MSLLLVQGLDFSRLVTSLGAFFLVTHAIWKYFEARRSPLNAIPTVGHSGILTSYITAFEWLQSGGEVIQRGYKQYPNQVFKIPTMSRWAVIASGRQLLDDLRQAPDDALSANEALSDSTQIRYTMGPSIHFDPYHIETVQSPITRNLVVRFDDIKDEIMESFREYIPPTEGWVSVPAFRTGVHIICRTSNRYFVGLPLCRNPGYMSLNEEFTLDVMSNARIIHRFPGFLKPLVGSYLRAKSTSIKRMLEYLGPTIRERITKEGQCGPDWAGKPNDGISWLLETAQGYQRTAEDIALRILALNFASLHTSAMSFTQTLYDLAIHPEYVKEMREEAEAVIEKHGWTKFAVQKMRKVDSFLKESQRLNSIGSMLMLRKTLKNWSFSDGTLIPAGTYLGIANDAMNKDEQYFPDAHTFKGFRFSEMRQGDGQWDDIKYQMVALDLDYMTVFGHGRHACPGRFFAVNELKTMFAYVLLNYDVQLEGGTMERPKNLIYEAAVLPDMKANVMFRKRVDV